MKSDPTLWGTPDIILSAPKSLNVSSVNSGLDFSLTMDGFTLQLEPDSDQTNLTQSVAFCVPFTIPNNQQLIGYQQTLLFGLQRTPGVRVLIMADLAGTAKTIEFDFADEILPEGQVIAVKTVSIFSVQGLEQGVGLYGDIADYMATINVTIQRRNLRGSGLVNVDGLDIRAITFDNNQRNV